MPWTPDHGTVLRREGSLVLVEMLDQRGKPSQLPPRWYVVALDAEGRPDWGSVTYHRYFSEAQRRLGINAHHPLHPDLQGK